MPRSLTADWSGLLLFVAEPLFLEGWVRRRMARAPESTLVLVRRFHWIMLILSLVPIIGAVLASMTLPVVMAH